MDFSAVRQSIERRMLDGHQTCGVAWRRKIGSLGNTTNTLLAPTTMGFSAT